MPNRFLRFAWLAAMILWHAGADAQMAGHGGPVRALAISTDGRSVLSGSFDRSAILWEGSASSVMRFHDGEINAVAMAPDGSLLTASQDGKIALWRRGDARPIRVFGEHTGPVSSIALSPDGRQLASASWDGTLVVRPLGGGEAQRFEGHAGNVNGAIFLPDGRLVSAGYDLTIRIWRSDDSTPPIIVPLPSPVNALAASPDGAIIAGGADGAIRLLSVEGVVQAEVPLPRGPILAVQSSPDGARIAAATAAGSVAIVDRSSAKILTHLVGPGLPVWSLAWAPDGREILTGGSDRLIRRWDAASGEPIGPLNLQRPPDILAGFGESRGAELFKACVACHTLTPDGGGRAGPTLHGVMGRRIATVPGFPYSDAFRKLDIVWTPETVGRLFEVGPSRYTPGTNMPEQTVSDDSDRAALVAFIAEASRLR